MRGFGIGKYLVFTFSLALLIGCSKQDDKKTIIGIWNIYQQTINGVPVGDGKDWIEFKPDGTCDTRPRTGGYESGNYTINPESKKITMIGQAGSLEYDYILDTDSLRLEAVMPNSGFPIKILSVRVAKYPITADQEPLENLNDPFLQQAPPITAQDTQMVNNLK